MYIHLYVSPTHVIITHKRLMVSLNHIHMNQMKYSEKYILNEEKKVHALCAAVVKMLPIIL